MVAGSILAARLAAEAQQTGKVYQIGHVSLTSPEDMAPYLQAFEEGLRELGYLKGRDFIIESRSANGNPELVSAAARNWCVSMSTSSSPASIKELSRRGRQRRPYRS